MDASTTLVIFALDGQRFAIAAAQVVRVVAAAEVVPLPGAPSVVIGLIDLQGEVVPVLDLRQRFGHAARCVGVEDQFLVVRSERRTLALLVDETQGVVVQSPFDSRSLLESALDEPGPFAGVIRLDDRLVLIHDIEKFLQAHESDALEQALRSVA